MRTFKEFVDSRTTDQKELDSFKQGDMWGWVQNFQPTFSNYPGTFNLFWKDVKFSNQLGDRAAQAKAINTLKNCLNCIYTVGTYLPTKGSDLTRDMWIEKIRQKFGVGQVSLEGVMDLARDVGMVPLRLARNVFAKNSLRTDVKDKAGIYLSDLSYNADTCLDNIWRYLSNAPQQVRVELFKKLATAIKNAPTSVNIKDDDGEEKELSISGALGRADVDPTSINWGDRPWTWGEM